MNNFDFTFSDLIAGYITDVAEDKGSFSLNTSDDRTFTVTVTEEAYVEVIRNLGEGWQDAGAPISKLLVKGRYVFAYGIFYPEATGTRFELKHLVLVGAGDQEWRFEEPTWWIDQVRGLADFYVDAQFGNGPIDFANYRTHLTIEGQKLEATRQETDTISRMIYGLATAYMLTGVDRYLEAAERGTEYLRAHMRVVLENEDSAYWYHAMEVKHGKERKILASEFGDDYDAIPAYEQIYALAGPMQTYRVTGDPQILRDAEMTLNLFDKFFLDKNAGSYFSHIDPVHLDPRDASLSHNRARKNWNSVGDHAPAYLINQYLATGDQRCREMLISCADIICKYFPDYDKSPFVNEKFFEDWSHDHETPLQKNRAIVGHNLKIAWNLMRIFHMEPKPEYKELAEKIASTIPKIGLDRQRGGVYDMMERELREGETMYRLIWHDRKAWWQQEQGILAYAILFGSLVKPEYGKLGRELTAFYNAWFPDVDSGGVYFNVLSAGQPYALGTERLKGSHSMSGYHSFELCYLAAVYTNLLITRQPLDLYFKPKPGALKDGVLRVFPDILPPGSIQVEAVWINDDPYADFEPSTGIVRLPTVSKDSVSQVARAAAAAGGGLAASEGTSNAPALHPLLQRPGWAGNPSLASIKFPPDLKVRARIVSTATSFDVSSTLHLSTAEIRFVGRFDHAAEAAIRVELNRVAGAKPQAVVLRVETVESITDETGRLIAFLLAQLDLETDVFVVGGTPEVVTSLKGLNIADETQFVERIEDVPAGKQ